MPLTNPELQALSVSNTIYSSGTVVISGGANVTVGTNGQTITISAAAGGGGVVIQNSQTTYTSGTVNLVDLANITIRSTTGQKFEFSVAPQSVQTVGGYAVGNTTGQSSSSTFDARSLSLAGQGIVSVGYSAGSVNISATVPAQTNQTLGVYASSNTTGQSSSSTYDARSLTVRGAGIISVGHSGGEILISASAAGAADGVNILAAGTQTANTTGTVLFVDSNGISFGMSNSSRITASYTVPTQSVQTIGGYAVGNTTGQSSSSTFDARTLSLAGQGIVSVGYSAGSVNISATAPAQTNQSLGIYVTAQSTGQSSSSTYDARTLSLIPDGIISAGWSNGSLRISATQSNQALSGSNGSFTFQTATFGNANGMSFLTSNGSMVGSYTVPTVPAQFSGGLSNVGNTSGDTGVVTGRLVLAGGNNVTLSGSTNAGSMTVTISAGAVGGGNFSAGVSNLGNTAGSTGISGTQLVLVGTNNITLSQSTGANGATVSISGAGGGAGFTRSGYDPYDENPMAAMGWSNGTLMISPLHLPNVTFDRIAFPVNWTAATNSTGQYTLSVTLGLYTSNGNTLSLLTSWTSAPVWTHSGTQNSSVNVGPRILTMGASASISEGMYWVGQLFSSSSSSANGSISHFAVSQVNSNFSGLLGVASATSFQTRLGHGHYSAATGAMPTSVSFAAIRGTVSNALRQQRYYFGYSTV